MIHKIKEIIENELKYFEYDDILHSIKNMLIDPYKIHKKWMYSHETHECWVVAECSHETEHIVYCETGFGPSFPWGRQLKDDNDMGRDDVWFAYLYEAFVSSNLWNGTIPKDFELKGPGERITSYT